MVQDVSANGGTSARLQRLGRARIFGGVNVGAAFAELFGTWFYVWMGTGTVLATAVLPGGPKLNVVAVSVAFALAVLVAVYVTVNISGAHLNPAVTVALATTGKFPWRAAPIYIAAQFVGGILAGLTNWLFFGPHARQALLLGATVPGTVSGPWVIFGEFLLTAVLMVTIMHTAVDERSPGPWSTGLAIGMVVGAGIFVMLPVTGGSFNPARTLGPMIVATQFPAWWAYIIGPVAGAVFGAFCYEYVLRHGLKPEVGQTPNE